ncbi:VCBS repeat-containing protein [Chitinophagaceae bacterium LB-8]|uniref:VCBS repeat-containing protein n=1 Tax=Paraflavisolibacter caeni TaxID=2982496 RepID=A0A9X2Y0U1_9BACT|nr:VCBS repeat-containing protein [Paraflavisolibacter caeni]MCU7552586.1 VCBS repeat-containing protein [Paraflavisolibacter caeni]
MVYRCIHITLFLFILYSCHTPQAEPPLFTVLDHTQTGLHFTNKLTTTPEFNMFNYMYFYNGAGVGAGDFNNDGLIDLFFASNQGDNKLYLNKGGLQFKDVTAEAAIPQDGGWSTGVSVVDINSDGLLDIYVCKVGHYETLHGRNQFLICQGIKNGIPVYVDKAKEYGLDFAGFSTQAAFFDYDLDGDLDMYLLNHAVHQNGSFAERKMFLGTYDSLSGDRLYRNESMSHFTDVTRPSGINSSSIGYGLGIAISDINLDGYPDIYIGNDFHENDYLYINQHNGTFKEDLTNCIGHTSKFSMGVDIADINNDALPEIISLDMMPYDPYILKRSLGEDEYNVFNMKLAYGYAPQYPNNCLQLNRGNGMFSEVGMYAGVYATDWSWAPLWMDFDNDGLKDLFVSNGIPRRLNDIDYVNFVSNKDMQGKIQANSVSEKEMTMINNFPQIKLPNQFFRNKGAALFEDSKNRIDGAVATFSNGAVYADFDNDGDLDLVVNDIDEPALLYQNRSNDDKGSAFVEITLNGPGGNRNAVGARVIVFAAGEMRTYEKYEAKGFQSSMEIPIHIGLNKTKVDSMVLIWPDNTYQLIPVPLRSSQIRIGYKPGLQQFNYHTLTSKRSNAAFQVQDITRQVNLLHRHEENPFVEFDREPLIPHMVSREGPALTVGDANGDGREDVFIGSSKGTKSVLFVQQPSGKFKKSSQPGIDKDSTYEDVDAVWADVNNDNHLDLVIASGGNEYYGTDEHLMPRVYINDGKGGLVRKEDAFTGLYLTASCVVPYDFTGDGAVDLFIGGRAVPWEYGQVPRSYLLQNDGQGRFKDVTPQWCRDLANVGFVKGAVWCDVDKDGDSDLVLALEWDGICALINEKGRFVKKMLTEKKGWWNFTLSIDIDGDGDIDLIAGNLGKNNRLKADENSPVRLYYNDFDGNGKKEQILTYYLGGKEIPFASKAELEKQIPILKKKFLYAEDFAKASLKELFTEDKLKNAQVLTADYFSNAVLINEGNWKFTVRELPWQAQLTCYKDAVIVNANNDHLPDVFMGGNFYDNTIQMGRYDADYGTLLINKGHGNFEYQSLNGVILKGQVRHIRKLTLANKEAYVLVQNNDSVKVLHPAP